MAKGCWWFHDGLLSKGELNPNSPKCEGVNMYSEESFYKYKVLMEIERISSRL